MKSILTPRFFINASGKTKQQNWPPRNALACFELISTAAVNFPNATVLFDRKPAIFHTYSNSGELLLGYG